VLFFFGVAAAGSLVFRIGMLCGSLRKQAGSLKALKLAGASAEKQGAELVWTDLGALPLFEDGVTTTAPAVVAFRASIAACDALLISTPVYHDSYSGVLKNALDHLYQELYDKVAALIAVGGGRSSQSLALEHLRTVLRETSTWVLPRQVLVPKVEAAFDEAGKPVDAEIETRLKMLGTEVVARCRVLRPRRA
jgi:NAD(P)H-dependent FMN reductase